MLKYMLLAAIMAASPSYADQTSIEQLPKPEAKQPERICHLTTSNRACLAMYIDLEHNKPDPCWVHAFGYFRGVTDLADEVWFSLPSEPTIKWHEAVVIYKVWYILHANEAYDKPAYMCVIKSLADKYPMPKKETEDE